MIQILSDSEKSTKRVAAVLAKVLVEGDCVALIGNLGSGKTVFAKGLAAGLGLKRAEKIVSSPTFSLVNEYRARLKIYHMDWYRLKRLHGEDRLMFEEFLEKPRSVSVIEWADRSSQMLPVKRIEVSFKRGRRKGQRRICLVIRGDKNRREAVSRLVAGHFK